MSISSFDISLENIYNLELRKIPDPYFCEYFSYFTFIYIWQLSMHICNICKVGKQLNINRKNTYSVLGLVGWLALKVGWRWMWLGDVNYGYLILVMWAGLGWVCLSLCMLVRAACVRCYETKCPLLTAALFLFLLSLRQVTFLPEGVIVGFQNFAWGLNSQIK